MGLITRVSLVKNYELMGLKTGDKKLCFDDLGDLSGHYGRKIQKKNAVVEDLV